MPSVPAVLLATVVLVFGLAACTTAEGSPAAGATRGERPDEPRRIVVLADLPPSIAGSPDAPAADGVDVAIERRGGRAGDHAVSAELLDLTGDPDIMREQLLDVRVFAGYAGWAPGQLEEEIATGSWLTYSALPGDAFTERPDDLWATVLRRQGGMQAAIAFYPSDPALN